jgi:hypothetical protein
MINPVKTSCGHIFEKKNLIKYFTTIKKMICPICKQNIKNLINHQHDYDYEYYISGVKVERSEYEEIMRFFD